MKWMKTLALGATLLLLCPIASLASGSGVVALQTADPSCGDDSGDRYVDCGNGTVTDNDTDLVWLADADCLGEVQWHTAMEFVAGLKDIPAASAAATNDCGLSDGSSSGEWRLPSIDEWEAMIEYADDVLGCLPTISDDGGELCWSQGCVVAGNCSFSGVVSSRYWSSTTRADLLTQAWSVKLDFGDVNGTGKSNYWHIWPVRGGQST